MNQYNVTNNENVSVVNDYVRSVYNWMAIGLALTGFVAYYVAHSPSMVNMVFGNGFLIILLFMVELGLVFSIAGMINKISASTATNLFLLYSALNGITLSFIFLVYAKALIFNTFFICAATFGVFSLYGWTTKKDLTSLGSFFTMGLFGIIIASVVNMFMRSNQINMMISYSGVFVFVGLTAYDTQKSKDMAMSQPTNLDGSIVRKAAIVGALTLYLDFINLFLMLLRIFGNSRD